MSPNFSLSCHHHRIHCYGCSLHCPRRTVDKQLQPRRYVSLSLTMNDIEFEFRLGFIALAQFPIVFLFATKNSIVSLLLGPGNGYERLNFIHRWSGRIMFLGAILHGALWIRNHLEYGLKIIGQQKETSGIAAVGLLGMIVLSSLLPVRRLCYEVFYIIQCAASSLL